MNSWTGSHENFQAREYDAGASQGSQRRGIGQLDKPRTNFEIPLKINAPTLNETIK
jgi:hypothetical protein